MCVCAIRRRNRRYNRFLEVTICGRLGAELLLVADYLNTAGLDQEEQLRLRISKLLRDVEMICSVQVSTQGPIPDRPQPSLLPCVEAKASYITT